MKIVVIGNQGCGKTLASRSIQEALKNVPHLPNLPSFQIIDSWDGKSELPDNCIALTHSDQAVVNIDPDA